ncbi:MAG TPA: Crp/Fnr family transcriptional regulator [Terriglobales bacterium]|jgi:CRP-like cAMP-binding protein
MATNIVTGTKSKLVPLHPGTRTDSTGRTVKNVLLLSIPDREYNLIRPYLEFVELEHHKMLHDQGKQIDFAYFPNDGMVSLVVGTSDGRSVEVGIVGREGMVGTPLAVGLRRAPYDAIVQIPGNGIIIDSPHLTSQLTSTPRLWLALTRFVLMQGLQMAQVAACNRLHELEQRLARWLLMCQDRVDSELLYLTHEFLAQMLGTGRPSVSLAIGILESSELIQNIRGTIRIRNRKALEDSACECYRVIQNFNGGLGLK